MIDIESLAERLVLGALLERVATSLGGYELVAHYQQGEFHHDVVVRLAGTAEREANDARYLVVATNCNGGVKEVLAFDEMPNEGALWRWRCPTSAEFAGELPAIRGYAKTVHWFEPCGLLAEDARSELKAEHRERQAGGGWRMCAGKPTCG